MTSFATAALPARPDRFWSDAPAYAALTLFVALTALPVLAAMGLDARLFQAESVWLKPLKFHIALAIYLATLAFYARWMPAGSRETRFWRWHVRAVVFAVLAELVWIGAAAAVGTASHFNKDGLWAAVYPVMGVLAITLTSASLVMGLAMRRADLPAGFRLSLVLGMVSTFALTLVTAGTMAQFPGHFVGMPVTGATLPVLGWSREVGDLRVAHFFATHALHGLPLVGWLVPQRTGPVWVAAGVYAALVIGLFVQALMGVPVI
ncbi:hypothetical protein HYN69_07275 [Gemmobacter aquarius]|uniref:Uncharacterized protein n=1 Tax=Paragemmobacter aquarius TaxID=2169400 RepID=A0A2S0UKL9_9RHOB|nr:hypothetical protein [Gemmobacter aquarius]AWB48341.1 hypothetical protein HYN69_07275 [Gemmobacter aquarius]